MTVPSWFASQISSEFDGQLRCRWSPFRERFSIERKRDKSRQRPLPPKPPNLAGLMPENLIRAEKRYLDKLQRFRDDYELVLEVAAGTNIRCLDCDRWNKLAFCEMRSTRCVCGTDLNVVFFPLGAQLLEHLRFTNPDTGGIDRVERKIVDDTETLSAAKERANRDKREEPWRDNFNKVFGIQSTGWTPASGRFAPELPESRPFNKESR
jgi:hypothetical protein